MNKESNIYKNIITVLLTLLIMGLAAGTASAWANPATVNLGNASNFAVLSKVAISDTVPTGTVITGDIGVSPAAGTLITGIDCTEVNGIIHVPSGASRPCDVVDPTYLTPTIGEMEAAYSDANSRAYDVTLGGDIGGQTLTPGVYFTASSLGISTDVYLDCAINGSSGVFIFQIGGGLDLPAAKHVNLTGGCQPGNIFWAVAGLTTIGGGVGTESTFEGTVLGGPGTSEIAVVTGSTVHGRLLGQKGIALDQNIITNPSSSSVTPVTFVTNVSVRMLNATGAATKIPTSVYYYYNGSNISINVSLNQSNLNVSGDFSQVGNNSLINTNWSYYNGSGEYIYNLTARNVSASMGAYLINITATNTTTSATNRGTGIALMNINPQVIDPTLGGTNWTTEIADFTNATLTFIKYIDSSRIVMLGKLEFLNPMNLANTTTATALQNLGTNLNISATSMNLNSAANALFAMNVSSRLSAYNLTNFTTSPAIFTDGVLIALPGNSSGGAASGITWDQSGHNLTLNVSHWTSYSWGTFGLNLTNISALSNTTTAGTNATYNLSLNNNGTANDTYTLAVVNTNSASTANVSVSSLFVAAGTTQTFRLNVTNAISGGTFLVNVTATSNNFSNRTASITTTTTVTANGTNLTNISSLTQSVSVSTNATYTFRIHNNGTANDTYTINVSNPNNARTDLNITSPVNITSGATQIFTLNVSNASTGTFRVNITVNSTNDPTKLGYFNTTTTVTTNAGSARLPVNLGTAGSFVILSKSGISTTGTTSITGNIGVSPAAATYITGFDLIADASNEFSTSTHVDGRVYAANYAPPSPSKMTVAVLDMQTAYVDAAGRTLPDATELGAGQIGGLTIAPGLYKWSSGVLISTDVTLSGNATDVWIFQIAQTLDISNGKKVILSGGAQAKNIFWVVAGQTTLGTTSEFNGTILDQTAIVLNTGAKLYGRALAQTAVTLDANTVLLPPTPTPVVITIVTPSNGSTNTTGNVNVTVTLDATGKVQYLKWQNQSYPMTPGTSQNASTVFFRNMTGLLSGNYTFKVYANGSNGMLNETETYTITVNRTIVNTTIGNISDASTFKTNATLVIASPGGRVTVTIPNQTNASINGARLSSISIDSLTHMNSTFAANLGSLDRVVGESINLGPDGAIFSPPIQIRFNYTDAMLTAAGVNATTLKVKFYNTSNNSWDVQTTYELNTTLKYIIANVSHFSTFALIGTASVPPATVNLGTAGNFVILAKTGISTTGTTSIVGDIGVSPAAASYITGFGLIADASNEFSRSPPIVTGKVYAANYAPPTPSIMTTAIGDMGTAYTDAATRPAPTGPFLNPGSGGDIGGLTLAPGLYKWTTGVTISTDVFLSGNATDIWIFQIAGTLDISSGKQVLLDGGALPKNIFWVVAGQTTLGTTSVFNGNILSGPGVAVDEAIRLQNGATLYGRALSQKAVTLNANDVSLSEAPTSVEITSITPSNGSTNTTGNVNVTVTLGDTGMVQYLKWQGQIYNMMPNTSSPSGTVFYTNLTGLLSGNHSFRVYANGTNGILNVSETRTITVNLTNITDISGSINSTTGNLSQDRILISPSRNVTVTIFNGTNATINGIALGNVTIDSPMQINATVTGLDRFVGENVTLGPTEARFIPDIQMRFNYTAAQLTAAGITDAGTLKIRFYNATTGISVDLTTSTHNQTGRYIIANATRFGAFALVGTAPTPPCTNCGGGGSGSGTSSTGGVVTAEPYENIARSETYEKNLVSNTSVLYTFKLSEHGIYEISVTGKESEDNVALKIEALKGPTKIAGISAPPGTVYKNLNIWAGSKKIKEGIIRFKVVNTWIADNKVASGELLMVRWNGKEWAKLEISELKKDDTYTFFEAKTEGFSSFAITALKGGVVPAATPVAGVTIAGTPVKPAGTATAVPVPTKKTPGFESAIAVAILSVAYLSGRKRR